MEIIFAKTLLRLLKDRGYKDAKAFTGATDKEYSNMLNLLYS